MWVDVTVNEAGQTDVLLPADDPVAGEDYEEPHESADAHERDHQKSTTDPPRHTPLWFPPKRDSQQQGNQQHRQHQSIISQHDTEIARHGCDGRWKRVAGLAWLAEKEQNYKKHGEDAERGHAIDILDTKMSMGPRNEIGPGGTADVDHRVINRVADRANVFFGSARRSADHAWLDQGNSERGKNEDETDKQAQRYRVARGRQPRCADRADQEI